MENTEKKKEKQWPTGLSDTLFPQSAKLRTKPRRYYVRADVNCLFVCCSFVSISLPVNPVLILTGQIAAGVFSLIAHARYKKKTQKMFGAGGGGSCGILPVTPILSTFHSPLKAGGLAVKLSGNSLLSSMMAAPSPRSSPPARPLGPSAQSGAFDQRVSPWKHSVVHTSRSVVLFHTCVSTQVSSNL